MGEKIIETSTVGDTQKTVAFVKQALNFISEIQRNLQSIWKC